MKVKAILFGCILLVIMFILGFILPNKIVGWQVEKQAIDYFTTNDVSLPFQTFTTFTYENIIANSAPWMKKYLDEGVISNIENAVRKNYSYRFDAAVHPPKSDSGIVNYFKSAGLLKDIELSEKLALAKLRGILTSPNLLVPKSRFTKSSMNEAPDYPVRLPAEFDPIHSVFVSFPIYFPIQWKTHAALIQAISSEAEAIVLVPDIYWQKAVMLYLEQKAVSIENVRFAYVNTDDVWIRDFGPTTVLNNDGSKNFIWNNYYEVYTSFQKHSADAACDLGRYFDIPVFRVPLVVEGGNIITDGEGTIIMFNSVLSNNSDYDLNKLKKVMKNYYGCNNLILLPSLTGELTGHIDMVVKYIDKNTLMVIESDKSFRWYNNFESIAKVLSETKSSSGSNYKIIRLKMPKIDNESVNFWSYINSLTLNGSLIVPTFGVAEDTSAIDSYRKAMPNYKIVGIDFSNYPVGSVHCQTKEMFK